MQDNTDELLEQMTARITDMEVKMTYLEDHIAQQDREMLKMRGKIEKMVEQLVDLQSKEAPGKPRDAKEEIPPHY